MTPPTCAEQALARRALSAARRTWGAGWRQLGPEAQVHAVYAQAFVLVATSTHVAGASETCLAFIRRLATEIIDVATEPPSFPAR